MARLHIDELEAREKLPDQRNHLVGHVLAARAADEQRRLLKAHLARVLEGKITQVVERFAQDAERHAEFLGFAVVVSRDLGSVEVAEKELSYY